MLRKVRFGFIYMEKDAREQLEQKLLKEGIEEIRVLGDGIVPDREELFLTDCLAGELWAKEMGCPCMGIETQERLTTAYVTEDWKWLDYRVLERIYRRYYRQPWTILETERCIVREITIEDLDELYELYEDKEITEFVEPLYEDRDKEKAYIKQHQKEMYEFFEYGMWLVTDKMNGRVIGRAGICNREVDGETQPEIGYIIGKSYQKQGYGTEVCRAIIRYAKEELAIEHLNCFVKEGNRASIRLAEKLGFEKVQETMVDGCIFLRKTL